MQSKLNEAEILRYLEPVFHFCVKRLANRQDAEDLAGDIMVHVLNGVKKYRIDSLNGWVWRIVHNRYARFIQERNRRASMPLPLSGNETGEFMDDYDFVDALCIAEEHRQVFKALHSLSSNYRNILVDYYLSGHPVKRIGTDYGLSEAAVKWRLNIGRKKIKVRMGAYEMDKVYKRINWNTNDCNGSMDTDKYLHSQIARAICEACYENPLATEEISLRTGMPTLYIEDELPQLIYGDAVVKDGGKYATNFIILRLVDRKAMESEFPPIIKDIADYFEALFHKQESCIANMALYGSDFSMRRLGYIALPAVLRRKIRRVNDDGPFPPRLDGGYGWFVVSELEEDGTLPPTESGCNSSGDGESSLYYLTINKYFDFHVYARHGTVWLAAQKIIQQAVDGVVHSKILTEDNCVQLLKNNLITNNAGRYMFNFPVFSKTQYDTFMDVFDQEDQKLDGMIYKLVADIRKNFRTTVPKRLDSQINQWVSLYAHNIIGFVAEELIHRGVLEKPEEEKPLVNGVFGVTGGWVQV